MKNLPPQSQKALLFSLAALVSIFLLATGLSGLELMPGEPDAFGFVFRSIELRDPGIRLNENVLNVIRIIYLIGLALFPFWLIYIIINPQARKRFIRDMITFGFFLMMILMMTSYFNERMQQEDEMVGATGSAEAQADAAARGDFGSGPPNEIMWAASILVALAIVGFVSLVLWMIWRVRRQKDTTLEKIATEVQAALDDLQAGGDFRNIVIRCYSEMVQALRERRGVYRSAHLTPREFEDTLQSLGFPMDPIHQLTQLFENVRYGHKPVTQREELIAVDSLTAILEACRSKG